MHAALLALTLSACLLTPAYSPFARLWDLVSGWYTHAPTSATLLEKEGPGLDPSGSTAPSSALDAGPGLDPSGHS